MVNTGEKVAYLFPNASPVTDYEVHATPDGMGYIKVWNTAKLGPQPTQAQLDAVTDVMIADAKMAAVMAGAVDLFLNDHSLLAVIERAGLLVLLDQVNRMETELQTLRDQLRVIAPTLPAVTYPQFSVTDLKNAVQAKVNSKAAN